MPPADQPFKSSYLKLARALEHTKAFHEQFMADYKAKPPGTKVRMEGRLNNGVIVADLIVTQVPEISADLSMALGDATSNFRASLDHAAWRLVRMWGADLTPGQMR